MPTCQDPKLMLEVGTLPRKQTVDDICTWLKTDAKVQALFAQPDESMTVQLANTILQIGYDVTLFAFSPKGLIGKTPAKDPGHPSGPLLYQTFFQLGGRFVFEDFSWKRVKSFLMGKERLILGVRWAVLRDATGPRPQEVPSAGASAAAQFIMVSGYDEKTGNAKVEKLITSNDNRPEELEPESESIPIRKIFEAVEAGLARFDAHMLIIHPST